MISNHPQLWICAKGVHSGCGVDEDGTPEYRIACTRIWHHMASPNSSGRFVIVCGGCRPRAKGFTSIISVILYWPTIGKDVQDVTQLMFFQREKLLKGLTGNFLDAWNTEGFWSDVAGHHSEWPILMSSHVTQISNVALFFFKGGQQCRQKSNAKKIIVKSVLDSIHKNLFWSSKSTQKLSICLQKDPQVKTWPHEDQACGFYPVKFDQNLQMIDTIFEWMTTLGCIDTSKVGDWELIQTHKENDMETSKSLRIACFVYMFSCFFSNLWSFKALHRHSWMSIHSDSGKLLHLAGLCCWL